VLGVLPIAANCCQFLAAGIAVVAMSLPTMFQARQYRFLRAAVFTMLGAWGVVPVTHLLVTNGHVWAIRTAFRLDLLMGLIYLVRMTASMHSEHASNDPNRAAEARRARSRGSR